MDHRAGARFAGEARRSGDGPARPGTTVPAAYGRWSPKTVTVPVALSTLWHEVQVPLYAADANVALFRWILCIAVRKGAGVGPFVWHNAHCCTVLAALAG